MLIIHIIIGLDVGGAELMLKRLIEHQKSNSRFQNIVVSLTDIGKVGLQLQDLGVEVVSLNLRSTLDIPRVVWRLVRLIHTTRPDIVQTWMYHADLLGGLAARLAGNRNVIWGIRTTELSAGCSRITSSLRKVCALLSYWVPHTIVCNAEESRRVHAGVGYDSSRMVVVPNGFDLSFLSATSAQRAELRAQCGFCADEVVIGSLGRFNADKDHQNFVRAVSLLSRKNSHVRFLMVGRDVDDNNPELTRLIADTGCADRFVLLGERDDVAICLAAMDIFCLHSLTEGFPNVVGEAMAMGLPCVVTDVGDAAMLVANTGFVVLKENSTVLAYGLERMLMMKAEKRIQLGRQARMRISAEFPIERACERFEAIYHRVSDKEVF